MSMDRETFKRKFQEAAMLSGLTPDGVARRCMVSRETVTRWISGASAPHPVGRQSVIDAITKE